LKYNIKVIKIAFFIAYKFYFALLQVYAGTIIIIKSCTSPPGFEGRVGETAPKQCRRTRTVQADAPRRCRLCRL
jgi:hypothetical protein